MQIKKHLQIKLRKCLIFKWAQMGSNQRPPDYESGGLAEKSSQMFLLCFLIEKKKPVCCCLTGLSAFTL
jgi:hypothetical protein